MAWVRLDDQFFMHPKITNLSGEAILLHLSGICMSAQHESDGILSERMVAKAAGLVVVNPKVRNELISAGVWEKNGADYAIHDFLVYNKSHAEMEAKRKADAERKAAWRDKQRHGVADAVPDDGCHAVTDAVTGGLQTGGVTPSVPVSVQLSATTPPVSPSLESKPLSPKTATIEHIFEAWASSLKRPGSAKLTPDRRRLIERALKWNYTEDELVDAVQGWQFSAWHNGGNPDGKVWNDLELCLRNASKIEGFRDLKRSGSVTPFDALPAHLRGA